MEVVPWKMPEKCLKNLHIKKKNLVFSGSFPGGFSGWKGHFQIPPFVPPPFAILQLRQLRSSSPATATRPSGHLRPRSEALRTSTLRQWQWPHSPLQRTRLISEKKGKDPHPQDKIQHLDFAKDPRPLYYKTPPVYFTTKMSVVRPFSVLSKDRKWPPVKRAVFSVRLKSWGWGSFPLF